MTCKNNTCTKPAIGDDCSLYSDVPPGFKCVNNILAPTTYSGCSQWQPIDVSATTCPTLQWAYGAAVPAGCIGQAGLTPTNMGVKISQTTSGDQFNMTPVVFKLSGPGAPYYPLFGFYNSDGNSGPSFVTYDLGSWLSFDHTGAKNIYAHTSQYTNCYVSEAAYITASADPACQSNIHIPAWANNMINEPPLTYDGVPFCYNTPGGLSQAPVSGTNNAPSTFTGMRAGLQSQGFCIEPSNAWGGSDGPESGSLIPYPVYGSDGLNK